MMKKAEKADNYFIDRPWFPQLRQEPFRPPAEYERWREQAGVVRAELHSDQQAWVVVRYDEAREALEDPRIVGNQLHPNYPKVRKGVTSRSRDTSLRAMDPATHRKYRRMVGRHFTAKRVNELLPELQRIVTEQIDSILAMGGPVDLHEEVSVVIPMKVICALLGLDYALSGQIQRLSSTIISAATPEQDLASATKELFELLDEQIGAQYENPREGLIGRLVEQSRNGEIERRQILGMSFEIVIAGHDSTANTISMGMLQLFASPDIRGRVTADLSLIPGMIEDMVRMHSLPDSSLSRVASEDLVLGAQPIKAGDGVIINLTAPNYDPRHWEDPYQLNIDRNDRAHVAFGGGTHACLGQNLARAELALVFEQLLTRIPTMRLADVPDPVEMNVDGFNYGVRRLMVDW